MKKIKKIVAIEPVHFVEGGTERLHEFANEVITYDDIPQTEEEKVKRIGDADAVLLSFTSSLPAETMAQCPDIRYVGMCCSLYSPESANVDIHYANAHGICVKGIRDYGDEGVVEYVISELVRILHGFDKAPWFGKPSEITRRKVGLVGLGKSGGMIADALSYLGAEISYFARSKKQWAKDKGYAFKPLRELLADSEIICCALNKNTVLMHEEEFAALGNHKILFNTGLSPAWDSEPFLQWIERDNICCCDTMGALGDAKIKEHAHVRCLAVSTGMTSQALYRLTDKVIDNIREYCSEA